MRWQVLGILGLVLAVSAPAQAQLVSREEITIGKLGGGADIVVLGKVDGTEVMGAGDKHEASLISITAEAVVKGPDEPGPIRLFIYKNRMPSLQFDVGERPLLFLKALKKDDLRCTGCDRTFGEVHDLPDGNYYGVHGATWGKILPGEVAAEMTAETLRLRAEGNPAALKDHLVGMTDGEDNRLVTDAVLDLLSDEAARETLTAEDASMLLDRMQLKPETFRPVEPVVALIGFTGAAEATPVLLQLLHREDPVDPAVLGAALRRLADSGVDVATSLRAELEGNAPAAIKGRMLYTTAKMSEGSLTDSVIALADDAELRKKALLTLGDLKDPRAIPVLVDQLDGGEMELRKTAAVALAYFLGDGLKALIAWQEAHPEDGLAGFIDNLRRNPRKVRDALREW